MTQETGVAIEHEVVNPLMRPDWDAEVTQQPQATFFHSAGWAQVLAETYGYQPHYFTTWRHGRLAALIPMMEVRSRLTGLRGVGLPFTDDCAPLAPDAQVGEALVKRALAWGLQQGWRYCEWRGAGPLDWGAAPAARYYGHRLDLSGGAARVHAACQRNTLQNLNKALREGVRVRVSTSLEALRAFYRLNCQTRRQHGLPPQPWAFFRAVHAQILERGHGIVVLGLIKDRPVAANVYFHFGERAIYKYGASDRRFQALRPNNLVMWEGIRWYADRGFQELSFGRTELQHAGLRHFKRGWGATEHFIDYYRYDLRANRYVQPPALHAGGGAQVLLRHLPIPLLRVVGAWLYRHMG